MTNLLIARTATVSSKFDALPYRNEMVMDYNVLHAALGSPTECVDAGALTYHIDLFTPKGEAYSVQLIEVFDGTDCSEHWSFYGHDEAFFIFCRWYVSVGGRAKLVRPERVAA